MTQHAVDMTKLHTRIGKIEKRMGKTENEIQTQNTLHMEELKKVKEENVKLQKQLEMIEKNHERDVKTINGEQLSQNFLLELGLHKFKLICNF